MKQIVVGLKGVTPLLMHRFPLEQPKNVDKLPPKEQAELAAYRDPDTGELYIPGLNIVRALLSAARFCRGKGRMSLQSFVGGSLFVEPERVGLGTKEYTIDARPVVVPATKGRVIRYRPRLDEWACSFVLTYDDQLLSEGQVRELVDYMCTRVGLLEFRPERKGPFGRSMVVKWEPIEPAESHGKTKTRKGRG